MGITKNVKRLELVRENCDIISVDAIDIARIYLNDISSDVYVDAGGAYAKVQYADTIYIKFKPSANKDHYELECIDLEQPIFELLNLNDIAGLDMFFDDGTSEYIQIQWLDDDAGVNHYQQNYMDDDGNLYIGIGEYADVKSFFNLYYQN